MYPLLSSGKIRQTMGIDLLYYSFNLVISYNHISELVETHLVMGQLHLHHHTQHHHPLADLSPHLPVTPLNKNQG
jgi:hypothetical protein